TKRFSFPANHQSPREKRVTVSKSNGDLKSKAFLVTFLFRLLGTSSVHFRGYSYARYHFNEGTPHYRCSAYRRTKCKVKLYVSDLGAIDTGHHTENCVPGFCRAPAGSSPTITDLLEEIMLVMDTFCGRDVTLTPTEVWRTARDQFYGDSKEIAMGAAQRQILGRLYRIRAKAFGWANFGRLERATLRRQRQRSATSAGWLIPPSSHGSYEAAPELNFCRCYLPVTTDTLLPIDSCDAVRLYFGGLFAGL
ncbi:FLYWCH zinc finger domain-containing protein, partial [Phytophthora infestans]